MRNTTFYTSHSFYSDPGSHRETLMHCGIEPVSMARWVGTVMQHPLGAESEKRGFTPEQAADLELRSVTEILSAAVDRTLTGVSAAGTKIGGVCRDFALLAVSRFRESGIPARLRVGFAEYIVPDHWEDHWLCEWFDGRRWKRFDVEFTAMGGLPFDTSDVPSERFMTAGEAWALINGNPAIAAQFGVSSLDLSGEWFVAGSVLREIAALRRLELKPWDYWGLSKDLSPVSTALSPQARTTLDNIASRPAAIAIDDECEPEAIADWPLPDEVVSFPNGAPLTVKLLQAEHEQCQPTD